MGSNEAERDWCERISKSPIDMLYPQHGATYQGADVMRFINWLAGLQVGTGVRPAAPIDIASTWQEIARLTACDLAAGTTRAAAAITPLPCWRHGSPHGNNSGQSALAATLGYRGHVRQVPRNRAENQQKQGKVLQKGGKKPRMPDSRYGRDFAGL